MQRKMLLLLIPLSFTIIFLFIALLIFLGIPIHPFSREVCGCHQMVPNYFFLILGILLILTVIPISYYFSSKKMEEKLDKHMKVLSKFMGKNRNKQKNTNLVDAESFLKFLNTNERRILEKLLEGKDILQSEISKMDNMTKLKTHRAVKNLEQKGIIKTKAHGKTKKIFLTEEIKKSLDV